ncbi:hypothetical protein HF325_006633 [Metschnikowia pulcherrima]|uniref:Uncharacterized protein n=1 Tax=Metschnikowia pulcherrima TaxID=27326 RepID=A0A8H7GM68_9ASCO|nr:hypothetical protein HF325_006633 [Metschnikowia pulcherrima]
MSSKVQTVGATTKLSQHEIIPHKTDVGALANRKNMETRALHNKIDKLVTLKFAIALRNYRVYRQGLQSFYHVFATIEDCLFAELENPNSEWRDTLRKDGLKHEEIVKLGTNFFSFDVPDEDNFRLLYKRDYELLTRNHLIEQQKQEIIAESMYIFEQNAKCVNELQEHNLAKILHTWQYFAWQKGTNMVLLLTVLVLLYYVARIGRWINA